MRTSNPGSLAVRYFLTPCPSAILFAASFFLVCLSLDKAAGQSNPPPMMQQRDGEFTSAILITSDTDWLKKWNTPSSTTPQFKTSSTLKSGDTAAVLIFFSGLNEAGGRLKLMCEIEIRKPNGATQTVPETVCYDEASLGQRKNVLIADARIEFKVQSGDPAGFWEFRIKLRDANSSARTTSIVGVRVDTESGRP